MKNGRKMYKKIRKTPVKYIPIMTLAYLSINLLGLALPLTMKKIYGSVLANKSYNELKLLVFGCLVALMLESILRKARDSSSKWIASKYEYQLSNYLIKKILGSYGDSSQSEDYHSDLEKLNSARQVAAFYSAGVYQLFIDVPFIMIFLYFIYILGGSLVWVPVTISVFYIVIMLLVSSAYFAHRKEQIEDINEQVAQLTETLDKIHLVKAAGLEEVHISKFNRAVNQNTEQEFICNTYQNIPDLISSNVSQLNMFTLLIYGGYLIGKGQITFAEITACVMLGGRIIGPVKSIMKLYLQRLDIRILNDRLTTIVDRECRYSEDAPVFPDDISGTIEFIDLEYENVQTKEFEKLTYSIPAGRMIHINPSVFLSYKEIIYKIIGRDKITEGKILIDNMNIQKWNMSGLKGKIEYISSSVGIYKGSIMDNITYFNPEKINQAYEAAALTGLDQLVSSMSDGFETKVEDHSKNYLSAAFMQRLNLTRALVNRPRILIIDRIDESMDDETLKVFLWLLEKFKNNMTILISSNNDAVAQMAYDSIGGWAE